ncbi:hypothetical protein K466DRAFT_207363 [Polyporus arcularius HHB13444]|uniref:Uncharacterized protein n=1 Tax=Polyporus arcularius HHB13444 TaxID=1314778 RepID=A0A5C3PGE2_9APHY|nr:hypothetical protein K466DRAFT_207363 [Polyporus arcularius HHB13444]
MQSGIFGSTTLFRLNMALRVTWGGDSRAGRVEMSGGELDEDTGHRSQTVAPFLPSCTLRSSSISPTPEFPRRTAVCSPTPAPSAFDNACGAAETRGIRERDAIQAQVRRCASCGMETRRRRGQHRGGDEPDWESHAICWRPEIAFRRPAHISLFVRVFHACRLDRITPRRSRRKAASWTFLDLSSRRALTPTAEPGSVVNITIRLR